MHTLFRRGINLVTVSLGRRIDLLDIAAFQVNVPDCDESLTFQYLGDLPKRSRMRLA
jgi:hypothetical protein